MAAPVLSTPAEYALEEAITTSSLSARSQLSEEQLYIQYEIRRTVDEIKRGKWQRIALQFPDDMLIDAPRVFERLRDDLRQYAPSGKPSLDPQAVAAGLSQLALSDGPSESTALSSAVRNSGEDVEKRLYILGDTSYGACCVDEVAAEHCDADAVVHYGRSCLSPTARLPVIYVFTSRPLDLEAAAKTFKDMYPDKDEKVCLMADIPYHHHISALAERIREDGYSNTFTTAIVHNPSSLIPNRTLPPGVAEDVEKLRDYSIFHISAPPTSLLLILSSRVKRIHVYSTDTAKSSAVETSSSAILRRRYGLITRLATVPIFGILVNTLSVFNYLAALSHCQKLIAAAGKKSYVFVVGKVNAAKVANFSEIGGWVVIGCWESSLIESKDFYRPIITPFELELALQSDKDRQWNGEWVGDFASLLSRESPPIVTKDESTPSTAIERTTRQSSEELHDNLGDETSDDEPPEFNLLTGRYVSHSRPMGRPQASARRLPTHPNDLEVPVESSSALVARATGDIAMVNGTISPAAEFLRTQRTWTGLGSDTQIAYERDEAGNIRGARMEQGRAGVARGYGVGAEDTSRS